MKPDDNLNLSGGSGDQFLSTMAYWDMQAQKAGPTAAVIDARDRRGLKNLYIDTLHKMALHDVLEIKDALLLDFGCGSGRFFPLTVGLAKHVVGLEISPEMLSYARHSSPSDRLELVLFDGLTLPFNQSHFDAVMSVYSMQYFMDDTHFDAMVYQIVACVKPKGKIYLLEQASSAKGAWQRPVQGYRKAFTDCGCTCVKSYPVRNGRSLLVYAIRYGLVWKRWLPAIARRHIRHVQRHRPAPWVPYQDYLFIFSKP